MAKRFRIEGMAELERAIKQLGRVPQSAATKAARAGGTIARKAAKANAPVDKGNLKQGLVLRRERKSKPGKAVYDVMPDAAMNDVFVKVSKTGERSYYPASQEYGFMTADGGYVPGYRYLRRAITEHDNAIERKIIDVAIKEIDKAWKGGGR